MNCLHKQMEMLKKQQVELQKKIDEEEKKKIDPIIRLETLIKPITEMLDFFG